MKVSVVYIRAHLLLDRKSESQASVQIRINIILSVIHVYIILRNNSLKQHLCTEFQLEIMVLLKYFFSAEDQIQDLMYAMQILYHWAVTPFLTILKYKSAVVW
jgi:hypothetical protein